MGLRPVASRVYDGSPPRHEQSGKGRRPLLEGSSAPVLSLASSSRVIQAGLYQSLIQEKPRMLQRLFSTSAIAAICLIAGRTVHAHDSVVPHVHPHGEASGLGLAPVLVIIAVILAGAMVLAATRVIRSPRLSPNPIRSTPTPAVAPRLRDR